MAPRFQQAWQTSHCSNTSEEISIRSALKQTHELLSLMGSSVILQAYRSLRLSPASQHGELLSAIRSSESKAAPVSFQRRPGSGMGGVSSSFGTLLGPLGAVQPRYQ